MKYDLSELDARVRAKKRDFLTRFTVTAVLGLMLIVLAFVNIAGDTMRLACGITAVVMLFYLKNLYDAYDARTLFSKEIKGENIKEDLYTVSKAYGPGLRYKQVGASGLQPFAPNTGANKRKHYPNLKSSVYLRLEDGNVTEIRGLNKEHIELYEEGDTLFKPAGAKYPIIVSRSVTRQPCPLCGTVNDASDTECLTCALPCNK